MNSSEDSDFDRWQDTQLRLLDLPDVRYREPLKAEASHRQFLRLHLKPAERCATTVIAMRSPPALERNSAFVRLATVFADAAVPVPQVLALQETAGWLLLSDLGTRDFAAIYGTAEEASAMTAALDLLPVLQAVRDPIIEPYTAERLNTELGVFSEWLIEKLLLSVVPAPVSECFETMVMAIDAQPKVCVHLDYHCRNLLWNEGKLGLVDFQDARHGPLCYDLASLLHDCYHRWDPETLDRYREAGRQRIAPALDPLKFREAVEWTALQRQLKAIGIFVRLKLRDRRATHLEHVLPTLDQAQALAARYADLDILATWLDALKPRVATAIAELTRND